MLKVIASQQSMSSQDDCLVQINIFLLLYQCIGCYYNYFY